MKTSSVFFYKISYKKNNDVLALLDLKWLRCFLDILLYIKRQIKNNIFYKYFIHFTYDYLGSA